MKALKQLLRQPLKTLSGILLLSLAVAVLCVSVGQAFAARSTRSILDEQFSSVAIPFPEEPDNEHIEISDDHFLLDADLVQLIDEMETEHPEIIKDVVHNGTLSAYIPQLTPFNVTQERYEDSTIISTYYGQFQSAPLGMPYSGAMFVITLNEIGDPKKEYEGWWYEPYRLEQEDFSNLDEYIEYLQSVKTEIRPVGYSIELTGTVTEVVSLQEGYRDPMGWTARLTLNVSSLEEFEAMNLVLGEQYLVYGTDYNDLWWRLVGILYSLGYDYLHLDPFDPDLFKVFTEEERKENVERGRGDYPASYNWIMLNQRHYEMVNAFEMTLAAPLALTKYDIVRNEEGYLEDVIECTQFVVKEADGQTVTLSKEEYIERYQTPTITHLDVSLEEFLTSNEGQLWKNALDYCQINNHAFTVVGVDRLNYFAAFALQDAQISEGRAFSAEELENGERVCLLHEWIAHNSGLQIGDTVSLNFYTTDTIAPYMTAKGALNPTASFYSGTTPFVETAEYTIVGFYSGEKWPDVEENPYAISANTVFVPASSVQTPMEESDSIVFITIALHNGKIEAFQELVMASGYGGRFTYDDQDYGTIVGNFHNYKKLARQVFTAGVAVYVVLLLLYLLLYPGTRRKAVRTMQSIGVPFRKRFLFVLISEAGVVLLATLLGSLLSVILWDRVVASLLATAETTVTMQLPVDTLKAIVIVQMLFALIANVVAALLVSAPGKMPRK